MTEATVKQIRAMLQRDLLSRVQVEELMRLGQLAGDLPPADITNDAGEQFWRSTSFARWANTEALHVRATLPAPAESGSDGLLFRGR